MASKTARLGGALFFCIIMFTLPARAQESTYSADSLMAIFDKSPRAPLRGAEIALRGVVTDNRNSKLIFKSSGSNKVICELAAPAAHQSNPPSVGSEVTVTGKVRGRGLLGNLTLDNCSLALSAASTVPTEQRADGYARPSNELALSAASTVPTEPAPEELANASPDTLSEEHSPIVFSPESVEEPGKEVDTTRRPPPAKPRRQRVQRDTLPPDGAAQKDQTANRSSDSWRDVSYGFYALLVVCGALGYAILAKLLVFVVRGIRFSGPSTTENTPQVRQAALQALLLKASKDKMK